MKTILILYVPVIHRGYLAVIEKYHWVETIYLLGQDFVDELADHVEIRALDPKTAQQILAPFVQGLEVKVLDHEELARIISTANKVRVVTADEAITKRLIERYFPDFEITFEKTFLRWEESNVLSLNDVPYDRVSVDEKDRHYMDDADIESQASSDWWRRVGAVLIKPDGEIIKSYNEHVPTEYTPYINGDPRDSIKAGTHSEFSSVIHSEKAVFAEVLRPVLFGADLYVTVFPCPDCAKLIASSGVKRLFFKGGHASLDGAKSLKEKGVEIIKVE